MLNFAYKKEYINYSYYKQSVDLLSKYGFKPLKQGYSACKLIKIMKKDKKATSDKITFIVPFDKKNVKEISLTPIDVLYALTD